MDNKLATLALAGVLAAPQAALAQDAGEVYNLGEIHVTAAQRANVGGGASQDAGSPAAGPAPSAAKIPFQPTTPPPLGGDTITARKFETFEKVTLDKAAELTPGVVADNLAGPRNEQNIFVHGFDRWQVPIYLDGVRIYLPADNRLDFGRFLTGNLAEIQISKGYDSVLNGPGGMGGAINLVTRKPTKEIEGEIGSALDFGKSDYLGERSYARIGTNQGLYYLQAAGTWNVSRGFDLPESFTPTANQGSGLMNHSATRDHDINLKAGYTPNASDEYSVNFLRQDGEKGVPYSTSWPLASQRYWTWPYWNVQTLSLHTYTAIDPTAYIESKFYWNRMDNSILSYSNAAQTIQNTGSAFDSDYHDWSLGASVEGGKDIAPWDTLKAAFHYRRDTHNEFEGYFVNPTTGTTKGCAANVVCYNEPRVTSFEDTYSVALENTMHVWNRVDLVQGFSYDWRNTEQARGFNSSTAPYGMIYYPDSQAQASNGQLAAIWRYNDTDKVYLDFSDRTRFPTLFERYSTRFGLAIANAALKPERAANVQLGWEGLFAPRLKVSAAIYGSIVEDMIETVGITVPGKGATTQSQNVGLGHIVGADFKADYAVNDDLAVGGQLGLIHREVKATPAVVLTGVPGVSGFLYASWRVLPQLTLTPSVSVASDRGSANYNTTAYVQTGAYTLLNFKAEYKPLANVSLYAGAKNLLDRLYVLTDGYPEAGRTIYLGARYSF